MITLAIATVALIILVAPLRRRLLGGGAWAFTLPALAAGLWGFTRAARMVANGAPTYMLLVGPVFAACVLGGTLWSCINEPRGRDRHDKN